MNIPEYKGKAYAASFDTPDAVARFMPILYPPMDLGGGFLQDAYNSYNIMFLKSAEQGAEEQDVKAAD